MSSDLLWLLTRNNSTFLVKRNGIRLSRDPLNVSNGQSLKYSGTSPKAVGVKINAKGCSLLLKSQKAGTQKVKSARVSIPLKSAKLTSVSRIVKKYRPDLESAAVARVARIIASQGPVKATKPKKTRGAKK